MNAFGEVLIEVLEEKAGLDPGTLRQVVTTADQSAGHDPDLMSRLSAALNLEAGHRERLAWALAYGERMPQE